MDENKEMLENMPEEQSGTENEATESAKPVDEKDLVAPKKEKKQKAEEEKRNDFTFTSSLLIHCGERVYFAKGTTSNIKITRKEDLALFEALLSVPEELLYS